MKTRRFIPFFCLLLAFLGAGRQAQGQVLTSTFPGVVSLDGDISDFFEADGVTPKEGVCVKDDPTPLLLEAPVSGLVTKSGQNHPSGFNQRRIISAYNRTLNGGTLFVGVDLPGGTGSAANPNYVGQDGPTRPGPDLLTAIRPFDADGNGDPEGIGFFGAIQLQRCTDPGASLLTVDIIDCSLPLAGGFTDAVDIGNDPGNKERYAVTVTFGDGTQVQVELFEDNLTLPGRAGLNVFGGAGHSFGAVASRDGANRPLGFDVEFAITNINANVGECARLVQTIAVNSGSLQDGSPNGEDFNFIRCAYLLPVGLEMTKLCPPVAPLPGQLLTFQGTLQNTGLVTLTNIFVVNDQPAPNTPVLGPVALAPGQIIQFSGSYTVPATYTNCSIPDTLRALGADFCSNRVVTASASAICPVRHLLDFTCPSNRTVQCLGEVPPADFAGGLATTTSGGVVVLHTGDITNGLGGSCAFEVIRTYRAVDSCSNVASCTQIITVRDTIPPVISCQPNRTVECLVGGVPVFDSPMATDNCDTNVVVTFVDSTLPATCPAVRIVRRTWTATDDCTNSASCSQTITFVDTTPPIITCQPDRVIECVAGGVPVFGDPTFSDACDTNVVVTFVDSTLPATCPAVRIVRRTWTATDDCTNRASCSQIITFVDTTPPIITCQPDRVIECVAGGVPVFGDPTFSDACDTNVVVTFVDSTLPATCPAVRIVRRTWTATDDCTNRASCSQTITFVDTTPPIITCQPDRVIECVAGGVPVFGDPAFSDACDTNVVVTFVDSTLPATCPAVRILRRTWTATDDCTNRAVCSQTITFIDTTPPVLAGVPVGVTVQCLDNLPPLPLVTATDACDTNVVVTRTSFTNGTCPTIIVHIWTATDDCTNVTSASVTNRVLDTIPPVLVGVPGNTNYQCLGDIPPPANVTATDNCDGIIPVTVTYLTNGSCPTLITCTWTARDRCTNSVSATRTITIQDTIPPVLVGVPGNTNYQCLGDIPPPANVTATDNCDGIIPVTVTYFTNGSCPTLITCTWTARDRCTNSVSATRTITVQDTTPPVLVGLPGNTNYQCLGNIPPPANVTATDNCDGAIPVTVTYLTNGTCPTIITCTWTAQDRCTNSVSASRTITVQDTTPPVLVGLPANATYPCLSSVPGPANVTAMDNCDGNVPVLATYQTNGTCPTIITCTWTAQDRCTNSVSATRTITIRPPAVTVVTAPVDQLVCTGQTARFCIVATQPCGVSYSWTKDGQPIPEATGNCLEIPAVTPAAAGVYCVVVAGPCDAVTNCARLILKSAVGDFVWEDINADGCQDPGEPGVSNVVVQLLGCASTTPLRTVTTDVNGYYLFDCLEPGSYRVRFLPPSGSFSFTVQTNPACGAAADSDPRVTDGITGCFTLPPGTTDRTRDAGLIRCHPAIDLEKLISRAAAGAEGLTPGFWKTHSRFGPARAAGWPETGYDPLDSYEAVFGVNVPGEPTLLAALGTGGGGVNALLRHSTAALLNSAHPNIAYAYTTEQVIELTRAAILGGGGLVESTKNAFAAENERGANLASGGGSGGPATTPVDADTPPGMTFDVGECPVFTYLVRNTGDCALTNVVLVDDDATPQVPADDFFPEPVLNGEYNVGDSNQNHLLDGGETWRYVAQTCIDAPGQYCNLAVVTATTPGPGGTPVRDEDPACWTATVPCLPRLVAVLDCTSAGIFGQPITFSGFISNAGNHAVTNVVVTHSVVGILATIPWLETNTAVAFSGSFIPDHCDQTVVSTVTATGRATCEGRSVTATDSEACSVPCPPAGAGGCRVTGGSNRQTNVWQSACITTPLPSHISHGGQVGASLSVETPFTPNSECIRGEWQHNRHTRNGNHLVGNFHVSGNGNQHQFDSLLCACLPCPESQGAAGVVGELCNPGDRVCGPEPRHAHANKICFSGVGDYTFTTGRRTVKAVFRVDIEDRGEGNSHANPEPPDRYRIRIWLLDPSCGRNPDPNSAEAMQLRLAASADPAQIGNPATTENLKINLTPDIDDGGNLTQGNHQIHPETGAQCTAAPVPLARLEVQAAVARLTSEGPTDFATVATGIQLAQDPAFVYRTVITNAGMVSLSNLVVLVDNGLVTTDASASFFVPATVLPPGASVTLQTTNTWADVTIQTITVKGESQITGQFPMSSSSTVASVQPPDPGVQLSVRRDGSNIVIEWPSYAIAEGYRLETSTNLSATAEWTVISGPISPIVIPGSPAKSTRFYRLRLP